MSTPITPAPTTPPAAPSAPATPPANPLTTTTDFDRYAAEALRAMENPSPVPPAPANPAAPAEPAAVAPESPATEVPPPAAPADAPPVAGAEADLDDPEPSAEELASLSDAGKRALQAERDKRKAAREEVKSLKAQLEALQAQITQPAPAPAAPSAPEATPSAPSAPSVPASLAECRTFDQIAAAELQAVQTKAVASELILAMTQGDRPAVIEGLKAQNVTAIAGTPLEDVSDAQLRSLLVSAHKGCELTITQAPQRRAQLQREAMAFADAGKILPGLGTPNHAAHKAFEAFVRANPNVRQLGPNWPALVAHGVANQMRGASPASVPAAIPATLPPPPPPPPPPSAPRTSTATLPAKSELDEIVKRLNSGQGTQADMDRYAVLALRG